MSEFWLEPVRPQSRLAPLMEDPLAQTRPVPSLAHTKPRRPRTIRGSTSWDPTIDIYKDSTRHSPEDSAPPPPNDLSQIPLRTSDATSNKPRRSSLFPLQATNTHLESGHGPNKAFNHTVGGQLCSRQGPNDGMSDRQPPAASRLSKESASGDRPHLLRQPRRSTVYVPCDDMTMTTIHPGTSLQQHKIGQQRARRSSIFPDVTASSDAAGPCVKELRDHMSARKKSLTVAPRKAPLQQVSKFSQTNTICMNVAGSGGGKENIPPDVDLDACKPGKDGLYLRGDLAHRRASLTMNSVSDFPPDFTHRGMPLNSKASNSQPKPGAQGHFIAQRPRKSLALSRPQAHQTVDVLDRTGERGVRKSSSLNRAQPVRGSRRSSNGFYPVLAADVVHQELYDDNWLSHQEAAITEMANIVFEAKESYHRKEDCYARNAHSELLNLYQHPTILLLHRRLQASLTFGALHISKDALAHVGRIRDDLQQRQRFLDFWTKTYNLKSLQAVVETVIGRTMPVESESLFSSFRDDNAHGARLRGKAVEEFLRVFLVRNEDVSSSHGKFAHTISHDDDWSFCIGSLSWAWRRTALRSLMIVLLLDRGQKSGTLTGCLFQRTSPFKSSAAAVQALGSLLLPSIGDVNRALEYLSYQVSYVQHPLEEHIYRIENIAVDLRDGILLSRLVEIFSSPRSCSQFGADITNPPQNAAATLSREPCKNRVSGDWVLSQRLKIPCASRAQKLYNVQIVLSALQGVEELEPTLQDISAEDIVDGHREKNIILMWSIFAKRGLDTLLDFSLVENEICRLERAQRAINNGGSCTQNTPGERYDDGDEILVLRGAGRHADLLKSWAQKVALPEGVVVSNLSSSFADGRAFRAVIAKYAACNGMTVVGDPRTSSSDLQERSGIEPTGVSSRSLEATISALGCSRSFAALFHSSNTIQSARTTIPLLAFLASRLLPASRSHFAAVSIQRAWRRKCARWMLRRRVNCAILARECAVIATARERIVNATVTLQRWWRGVRAF